ncbi:unnamed protein product, partial [Brenthis ino]
MTTNESNDTDELEFHVRADISREEDILEEDSLSIQTNHHGISRPSKRNRDNDMEEVWTTVQRKGKRFALAGDSNGNSETREQKIEVCIICKEQLPKQFKLAKLLRAEKIQNVVRVKYINSYKVLIEFDKEESAEELVNSKYFNEMGYNTYKTMEINRVYGVIKDIDLDRSDEEILESLYSTTKILEIKRLKRKNKYDGRWETSEAMRICFEEVEAVIEEPITSKSYAEATKVSHKKSKKKSTSNTSTYKSVKANKQKTTENVNLQIIEDIEFLSEPESNLNEEELGQQHEDGDKIQNNEDDKWKVLLQKLREKIVDNTLKWEENSLRNMDLKNNEHKLNIIQWNAQNLRPKLTEFGLLLNQEKIHIAIVSETWLDPNSFLAISGYKIFRSDRRDGYGGVAIIVHWSIKAQQLPFNIENSGIECVYVKIFNCGDIENIISLYCPPAVNTLPQDWSSIFSKFRQGTVLAGDFNGHHCMWSCKSDARGVQIYDSLLESSFISLNDCQDTRLKMVNGSIQKSSPDISLVTEDIAIKFNWNIMNENLGSDHLMIKMKVETNSSFYNMARKRNFKKADWTKYSISVERQLNRCTLPIDNQEAYNFFINTINAAADEAIPYINICMCPMSASKLFLSLTGHHISLTLWRKDDWL